MAKKAIKCSKLFDSTTGTVREHVVIFTDGDRVEAVVPAAEAQLEGCEVIDLTGKFVTPVCATAICTWPPTVRAARWAPPPTRPPAKPPCMPSTM